MTVQYEGLLRAIQNVDVEGVAKIFEEAGVVPGGGLTSQNREVVAAALGFASAMERWNYDSCDLMATELIQRTAAAVELYPFLWMVSVAEGMTVGDFGEIPKEIRVALEKNRYSDKIADAINELDSMALLAVINLLSVGEVREVATKFNLPIIWNIYKRHLVPAYLLFAYMGICLSRSAEEERFLERIDDYRVTLGAHDRPTALAKILEMVSRHEDDGK